MQMKGMAITLGLGIAAGAVAVMMLPSNCIARKLASKAATKVEDTATKVSDKLNQQINNM